MKISYLIEDLQDPFLFEFCFAFLIKEKTNGMDGNREGGLVLLKRCHQPSARGRTQTPNFSDTCSKAPFHWLHGTTLIKMTKRQRSKPGIIWCGFLGPVKEMQCHMGDHKKINYHQLLLWSRSSLEKQPYSLVEWLPEWLWAHCDALILSTPYGYCEDKVSVGLLVCKVSHTVI